MRSTIKYTIITLVCISLTGCFGSTKKRSRVAVGSTSPTSGVNWISGFASYKTGNSTPNLTIPPSLRHTDFSQAEYNDYGHCIEGRFVQYGGSNLNSIINVLNNGTISDYETCCTQIGRKIGAPDESVLELPDFTLIKAIIVAEKIADWSNMPRRNNPSPKAFGVDVQFPSADWVTKIRAFYAGTDLVKLANDANPSDPAKPFVLGASGDATLPSGQTFASTGGVLGPDEGTLIAFINATKTRSVRDILNWYYKTFPVVHAGWWAEYFYEKVFFAMIEEKLLCKKSALRTQWIKADKTPTEFEGLLNAAERDYICNDWKDSALNLVNQVLMANVCQKPTTPQT